MAGHRGREHHGHVRTVGGAHRDYPGTGGNGSKASHPGRALQVTAPHADLILQPPEALAESAARAADVLIQIQVGPGDAFLSVGAAGRLETTGARRGAGCNPPAPDVITM